MGHLAWWDPFLPALACMSIANRSITFKVAVDNNGKASIYIMITHAMYSFFLFFIVQHTATPIAKG